MMRYLIIMNKNSGIPLFSQSYGFPSDEQCESFNGRMDYIEPDMIGGFLATLMGFGKQFNYGEIREINFQDIYILSKHAEDVVIVAVEDEIEIIQETKAVLDRIGDIFFDLARFGRIDILLTLLGHDGPEKKEKRQDKKQ